MKAIIDRFEGKYAVIELEDKTTLNIEKFKLPKEAREGDVVNIEEKITIDKEETKKRSKRINALAEDLWK